MTRCYGLSTPENGMIELVSGHGSCIESAVYGSRCAVSCEAGHTLSTEGTTLVRQCDRLGEQSTVGFWTQNPPSCNGMFRITTTKTYSFLLYVLFQRRLI